MGTFSFGDANVSTGDNSIAGGSESQATGIASVALGDTVSATDDGAFAAGFNAQASAQGAVALGYFASASGLGSFAANAAQSAGTTSAAFGEAVANGLDSAAFGKSTANGTYSASFGQSTATNTADFAQGEGTTAQGGASHSTGDSALAGIYSQHAYASSFGSNSSSGMNAQGGSEIVMSGTYAGGSSTPTVLEFGPGGTEVFPVLGPQLYNVSVRGTAGNSTTGDAASFNYVFLILSGAVVGTIVNNNPAAATPAGATVFTSLAAATWTLTPSVVGGNLELTFNPGVYASNVNVAATLDWTEVAASV